MSNLVEFEVLDISGENYLTWVINVETHLRTKGLLNTINKSKESSHEEKAKAHAFIVEHLHKSLMNEYTRTKDPADLWTDLKARYDHQEYVMLPKSRFKGLHSNEEYNSSRMKNHDSHPTDSTTLPEENTTSLDRKRNRGYRSAPPNDKACYLFSFYSACCNKYSD